MEQALEKRSKDYSKQSENLRNLAKSIRQQFKRVREKDPEPSAKVLSKKECLDTIAQSTPQMNSVHIMSPRFPNITYNEGISKRLKRGKMPKCPQGPPEKNRQPPFLSYGIEP